MKLPQEKLLELHNMGLIKPNAKDSEGNPIFTEDGSYEMTDLCHNVGSWYIDELHKENKVKDKIQSDIETIYSDIAYYVINLEKAYYESPTLKEKIKFKLEDLEKLNLDLEKLE